MLLLVYSAWVRGGTYPPFQLPLVVMGGMILLSIAFAGGASAAGEGESVRRVTMAGLRKDPVFYVGALFLLLLLAQWLNAGRRLVFDFVAYKWTYTPPPVPWLPSAFVRADAREMLCWFFPAWATALAMRSGLFGRQSVYRICIAMATSAALLSVFGLVQYLSGTRSMYWIQPLDSHFFASFGYPNHAGAYFILMLCLSSGLLIRELRGFSMSRLGVIAGWVLVVLLALVGATLSLSRAAILLSWGIAGIVFLNALLCAWRIPRLPLRINVMAGIIGITLLGLFLATTLSRRGAIAEELASITRDKESANLVAGDRALVMMHKAAFAIWRDHPWFGVGGWGFRYLVGMYIAPGQWGSMTEGKANIHDDPLQFAVEFGAVGGFLLAVVTVLLVKPALSRPMWFHPVARYALMGCGVVFLYSFIDLPFRSPAILYAWTVMLTSISVLALRGGNALESTRREYVP